MADNRERAYFDEVSVDDVSISSHRQLAMECLQALGAFAAAAVFNRDLADVASRRLLETAEQMSPPHIATTFDTLASASFHDEMLMHAALTRLRAYVAAQNVTQEFLAASGQLEVNAVSGSEKLRGRGESGAVTRYRQARRECSFATFSTIRYLSNFSL